MQQSDETGPGRHSILSRVFLCIVWDRDVMCQLSVSILWFDVLHDLRVATIPFLEKEIALGEEIYELLMQINAFPFGISTTDTIVNIKRVNGSCGFQEILSIICGIAFYCHIGGKAGR